MDQPEDELTQGTTEQTPEQSGERKSYKRTAGFKPSSTASGSYSFDSLKKTSDTRPSLKEKISGFKADKPVATKADARLEAAKQQLGAAQAEAPQATVQTDVQTDVLQAEAPQAEVRKIEPGTTPFARATSGKTDFGKVESVKLSPDKMASVKTVTEGKRNEKSKKKRKKALIAVAIIIPTAIALSLGALLIGVNRINSMLASSNTEEAEQIKEVLVEEEPQEPFYMLVLGVDEREGLEGSRSDSMILLRVDAPAQTITMISIPRDTLVDIPGYDDHKINASYSYGGVPLAIQTVSQFAGVPISHYATLDFEGVQNLIDYLGSVWVEVPVSTGEGSLVKIEAGGQWMDGETALAWARERKSYARGDFQRADNQRILAQAVIKQILSLPAGQLPGLVPQLCACVSTDFQVSDLISLARDFRNMGNITFYSAMTPVDIKTIGGISYDIVRQSEWDAMMDAVRQGHDPNVSAS